MKHYWEITSRYLKQNKKRTMFTIFGVALTVLLLYAGLNLAYGYLLQQRQAIREQEDYELILFTTEKSEIEQILADDRIQSAYIGPYYAAGQDGTIYQNALYVNTSIPYRMNAILADIEKTYGVSGTYNQKLASLYIQGQDGSYAGVLILAVLLIAYIFAVFGVGIVRTSIQLSMLENVEDYGILCCIGSTGKQVKRMILLQGLVLEGVGVLIGTVLGTGISQIIKLVLQVRHGMEIQAGFHILPFFVILVVFLLDLYFVMLENARMVVQMDPVEAVRGEFHLENTRIKVERKHRFSETVQKIFSVESNYAWKNVRRNPRRFWKTIAVFTLGMILLLILSSVLHAFVKWRKEQQSGYQYYQLYVMNKYDENDTIETAEAELPATGLLEELLNVDNITEAKRIYAANTDIISTDDLYEHMTEPFLNTATGKDWQTKYDSLQAGNETPEANHLNEIGCYGYTREDLQAYQSVLVDGTLDIDSQGVILVNQRKTEVIYEDIATGIESREAVQVPYTNYSVGDTIQVLDIAELHRRIDGDIKKLEADFMAEVQASIQDPEQGLTQQQKTQLVRAYIQNRQALIQSCKDQMREEGCYKTYVIEGIVSEDVNLSQNLNLSYRENLRLLMPLENYCELTGTGEDEPTGMMYHVEGIPANLSDLQQITEEMYTQCYTGTQVLVDGVEQMLISTDCEMSGYMDYLATARKLQSQLICAGVLAVFIITIFLINVLNTVASNLFLRRGEFAQLRVIGVTKAQLVKMVVMEGVFAAGIADVIGILIGTGISYGLVAFLNLLSYAHIRFTFPGGMTLVGILMSVLFLCGTIYAQVRRVE